MVYWYTGSAFDQAFDQKPQSYIWLLQNSTIFCDILRSFNFQLVAAPNPKKRVWWNRVQIVFGQEFWIGWRL